MEIKHWRRFVVYGTLACVAFTLVALSLSSMSSAATTQTPTGLPKDFADKISPYISALVNLPFWAIVMLFFKRMLDKKDTAEKKQEQTKETREKQIDDTFTGITNSLGDIQVSLKENATRLKAISDDVEGFKTKTTESISGLKADMTKSIDDIKQAFSESVLELKDSVKEITTDIEDLDDYMREYTNWNGNTIMQISGKIAKHFQEDLNLPQVPRRQRRGK